MTEHNAQDLPEYANPPVTEVACGMLFEHIEKFYSAYLGLLWEKYRAEYPICQEVAPIMPSLELPQGTIQREPSESSFLPRTWFIQSDQAGLIQVQRDRFLYNWRKVSETDEYPRFHTVMQRFKKHFGTFKSFLHEHNLGELRPLQYELTYVNHILEGAGWNTFADIGNVFPDFGWRENNARFLPLPEGMNWQTSFLLPNQQGRLHVSIRRAQRRDDGKQLLVLDLTARGFSQDTSEEAMYSWYNLARMWIVRGFADLTSETVQQSVWRRT